MDLSSSRLGARLQMIDVGLSVTRSLLCDSQLSFGRRPILSRFAFRSAQFAFEVLGLGFRALDAR
jgi:hypothetical protein